VVITLTDIVEEDHIDVMRSVKLEVGAGSAIKQKIHDDPNDLDFWRDKPENVLVINYSQEENVAAIISQGRKDVLGSKEGFLDGINKGNKGEQS
jgi:hypothetical protein